MEYLVDEIKGIFDSNLVACLNFKDAIMASIFNTGIKGINTGIKPYIVALYSALDFYPRVTVKPLFVQVGEKPWRYAVNRGTWKRGT